MSIVAAYILIIFVSLGSTHDYESVEFNTLEACQAAIVQAQKTFKYVKAFCTPKG